MTEIKFCGLSRPEDIRAVNALKPEYIGFVFWEKSKRYVSPKQAAGLKKLLDPGIKAVGVFIDEEPETVASLLNEGIIDIAQLHGSEDAEYLQRLRRLSGKPVIKAFRVRNAKDLAAAKQCPAEMVLLDSGAGTGMCFDWSLLKEVERPFFLAGGLSTENVEQAIRQLHPFAVDVSSGIETDGMKDPEKMAAFAALVRKEEIA